MSLIQLMSLRKRYICVAIKSASMLSMGGFILSPIIAVAEEYTQQDTAQQDIFIQQDISIQQKINLSSEQKAQQWIQEAAKKKLADNVIWHRLLYYPDKSKSSAKNKSEVENKDFFVSNQGNTDPQAELTAMLQALAKNDPQAQHLICKFPARTQWLKSQLDIDDNDIANPLDITSADKLCQEYQAWFHKIDPQQLSVIFAEEYINKPVSAFAHMLLRIDSKESLQSSSDNGAYALNYTVKGNSKDNFAKYTANSMVGKYPAITTIDPFAEKINYYLHTDGRDIWSYRLNISNKETQQILRHVWEVKDLNMPYYFLTDNCASEVLRLIDTVRPNQSLFKEITYAAIPSEVIHLLNSNNLLLNQKYTPSERTKEQAMLNKKHEQKEHASDKIQIAKLEPVANNPLDAASPRRVQIGAGMLDNTPYLQLGLRASYHNLLDSPVGVAQFLDLRAVEGKARIYRLKEENQKTSTTTDNQYRVLQV